MVEIQFYTNTKGVPKMPFMALIIQEIGNTKTESTGDAVIGHVQDG